MNLITSLMGGDWLTIGAAILALGSLAIAFLTKKSSDAKVAAANQQVAEAQTVAAQAQTQTAETRDVAAQANASAAQAGAQAVKERINVEADTAAKSDGAVRDELRAWVRPASADAGAGSGSGTDANR